MQSGGLQVISGSGSEFYKYTEEKAKI